MIIHPVNIDQTPEAFPTIQRVSLDKETEEISVENALSYIENDQVLEAFNIAMIYAQKGAIFRNYRYFISFKTKKS